MPESASNSPEIVKESIEALNVSTLATAHSISDTNRKTVGDVPALAQNTLTQGLAAAQVLAAQNSVSAQQRMNAISEAATTAAVDRLLHVDPMQALATNKAMTGNDVASQMQSLLAALNSGGQGVKAMQSTPPVSVPPPAV